MITFEKVNSAEELETLLADCRQNEKLGILIRIPSSVDITKAVVVSSENPEISNVSSITELFIFNNYGKLQLSADPTTYEYCKYDRIRSGKLMREVFSCGNRVVSGHTDAVIIRQSNLSGLVDQYTFTPDGRHFFYVLEGRTEVPLCDRILIPTEGLFSLRYNSSYSSIVVFPYTDGDTPELEFETQIITVKESDFLFQPVTVMKGIIAKANSSVYRYLTITGSRYLEVEYKNLYKKSIVKLITTDLDRPILDKLDEIIDKVKQSYRKFEEETSNAISEIKAM